MSNTRPACLPGCVHAVVERTSCTELVGHLIARALGIYSYNRALREEIQEAQTDAVALRFLCRAGPNDNDERDSQRSEKHILGSLFSSTNASSVLLPG